MDETPEIHEPKISLPEAMFIGGGILVLDLIDLIPGAGDVTDLFTTPVNFYLYSKGVNGTWFVVSQVLDLFPIVQEFPTRSLAWAALIYLDRNPSQIGAAVEKIGELEEKAEGVGGASEEVATKEAGTVGETAGKTGAATATEEVGVGTEEAAREGGTAREVVPGEETGREPGRRPSEEGPARTEEEEGLNDEEREKRAREEAAEREMRSGAEIPYEEEMQEELFNPEEAQFHEAEVPSPTAESESPYEKSSSGGSRAEDSREKVIDFEKKAKEIRERSEGSRRSSQAPDGNEAGDEEEDVGEDDGAIGKAA